MLFRFTLGVHGKEKTESEYRINTVRKTQERFIKTKKERAREKIERTNQKEINEVTATRTKAKKAESANINSEFACEIR